MRQTTEHTDKMRCPDCGIPTIDDVEGTPQEYALCNLCNEVREQTINRN